MPKGIREAAQRSILIPFVGAGVSRLAGCPSWGEFADGALKALIDQGKFTHAQLAQIHHLHPRIKMSIAHRLEADGKSVLDYPQLLCPQGYGHAKGLRLYESLSKLGKTFITTNYDQWLDVERVAPSPTVTPAAATATAPSLKPRNVFYKVEDLTIANLNLPETVVHLHGSVVDPSTMILTTRDYVQHYSNSPNNPVPAFLEHLFREKVVLFLGYGLEELEILEYVVLKARHTAPQGEFREAKHFLLQGFFSHEQELLTSMKRYYLDECGIELIPFLRDHLDWDQLLEVVLDFARQVPASSAVVLQQIKEMEGLLDD